MENAEPFTVERVYYFNTLPCFSACPVGFYCTRSAPIFQNLSYGKTLRIKQRENLPRPFFWNSFSDCSGPYFFCEEQTRAEKTSAFSARVFIGGEAIAFRQIGKESAHCGMPCRIRKCRTDCVGSLGWSSFCRERGSLFWIVGAVACANRFPKSGYPFPRRFQMRRCGR